MFDPDDQEMILEQLINDGERLIEAEEWAEAGKKFSIAFSMKQSFEFNKKAVMCFIKANEGDLAEEVAYFCYDKYLLTGSGVDMLVNIFLENGNFLMLEQLKNMLLNHRTNMVKPVYIDDLTKRMAVAEQRYLSTGQKELLNQEKELTALVTMPMAQQADKIKAMKKMPLNNFVKAAKSLLLNPYLHPLLKSDVVENLVKLDFDEELAIVFWGETRKFNPINLRPIVLTDQVVHARDAFSKKSPHLDDFQLDARANEFTLCVSMVYPFNDEIINIDNLNDWIEVFTEYFNEDGKIAENVNNVEEIRYWYRRFSKMLDSFAE